MNDFLEKQILLLKKVEENELIIKKTKPFDRPKSNEFDYIKKVYKISMLKESTNHKDKDKHQIKMISTFVNGKKHYCRKNFNELQKITLNQMKVNQIHYGKFLEARIVYEPFCISGIQTLIVDENDDCEVLSIYNLIKDYYQDPSILLPIGTIIWIKEPYLKFSTTDKNNYFIRVDSPSDLSILYDHRSNLSHRSLTDKNALFEEFNKEGNILFINNEYFQAIRSYTKALTCNQDPKAFSNRSAAYLKLENFNQALIDAESSLKIEPSEKAYFRAGMALYNMRQFESSLKYFKNCLSLNEKNSQAKEQIDKINKRKQEMKGNYDFKYLLKQIEDNVLRLDVADFVSDLIERVEIKGKSKAITAKCDIKKKTLLVASKAASISYDCEFIKDYFLFSHNLLNKTVDLNSQCQNLLSIIYKMRNDPNLAKQVYTLYAGPDYDQNQIIDDYLIDTGRVENILTFNTFRSETIKPDEAIKKDNSGLWIAPSYFNHSCVPNTFRIFFKDLLMIYSSRDIKKGEEITISYFPLSSYKERTKLTNKYCFKCDCELCEQDRNDMFLNDREDFLDEQKSVTNDLKKAKFILNKIREMYKTRTRYKHNLIEPLSRLASIYVKNNKLNEANDLFLEAFEISNEMCNYSAYKLAINVYRVFMLNSRYEDAEKWLNLAIDAYKFDEDYFNYLSLLRIED